MLLFAPAGAEGCVPTTSQTWADTDPAGVGAPARLYVVFDNVPCQLCMTFYSMWVYEESNGIDGLQRGDEVVDDTCHGQIARDTIIL